jgi:hypothetical protein
MRLNMRQRIVLLVIAFLVPALTCLALLARDRGAAMEQNRRERWGIEYLRPLQQLRERLPELARAAARGEAGASVRAAQQWEGLQQVRARLNDIDLRLGGALETTEDLMRLDQELSLLAKRRGNAADPQLFTEAEHRTRMLTTLVGDSSGLILDSSLDSFYLAKALLVDLPGCQERLQRLQTLAEQSREAQTPTKEQRDQVVIQVALLRRDLSVIEDDYRVAAADNPVLKSALELPATQLLTRARTVANLFEERAGRTPSDPAAVPGALSASFQLCDSTLTALDKLLHQRIDQEESERLKVATLVLLGLLPGLGLATGLIRHSRELPAVPFPASTSERTESNLDERHRRLAAENQRLKALVADLVLEQRIGTMDGIQGG